MSNPVDWGSVVVGVAGALLIASDFWQLPAVVADSTPVIGALALFVTALSLAARRPWSMVALAVLGLGSAAYRMLPDMVAAIARQEAPQPPTALKVMTVNVWSFNADKQLMIDLVLQEAPHIVVVQEAFHGWPHKLAELAPRYKLVAGCAAPHECNVLILSSLEVSTSTIRYDSCCVGTELVIPSELGGGRTRVVGLHLSRNASAKQGKAEFQELLARTDKFGALDFVAGDMNAVPWSALLRRIDRTLPLSRVTHFLPSWPTPRRARFLPALAPIDHIYAGCAWRPLTLKRGPDIGSDHFPIIATFARTEAACRGA